MLVVVLFDPDAARRESRQTALRSAGHVLAAVGTLSALPGTLSPEVVILPEDLDPALREAIFAHVGTTRLVHDDGDIAALLATLRRLADAERPRLQIGPVFVEPRARRGERDGVAFSLSQTEAGLLSWLLCCQEAVTPRQEMLVHIWGYHPASTSRTVDVTIRRLREKLEIDPQRPQHLLTARGEGYRLVGARPAPPRLPDPPLMSLRDSMGIFGREQALSALRAACQPGQVLTLLGPPGIGKTTLARALLSTSTAGLFVALAHATTDDDVAVALGAALGLGRQRPPTAQLAKALTSQGDAVVVLDNAEQVVDGVISVLSALLPKTRAVRWVVTSRVRLRMNAEQIIEVEGLAVEAGVEMFLARARQRRPGY
ncbi:MAG: winged helix-turn-helix domain-containing protein, partial [Myxococcota bacterium]